MSQEPSQWAKAEELNRLLLEEPTAAKEHILSSASNAAEAVQGLNAAISELNRALMDLLAILPQDDERKDC